MRRFGLYYGVIKPWRAGEDELSSLEVSQYLPIYCDACEVGKAVLLVAYVEGIFSTMAILHVFSERWLTSETGRSGHEKSTASVARRWRGSHTEQTLFLHQAEACLGRRPDDENRVSPQWRRAAPRDTSGPGGDRCYK